MKELTRSQSYRYEDHILAKFATNTNLITNLKQASACWIENIESAVKRKVADEDSFKQELKFFPKGRPRKDSRFVCALLLILRVGHVDRI